MNRRKLLKSATTCAALTLFPFQTLSEMNEKGIAKKNFIWILLRGAQDPLSTLIPYMDKNLDLYRPTIWPQLKKDVLKLNSEFALHPKLETLSNLYKSGNAAAITSVSSGYDRRSHFQGQDYLECGKNILDFNSGWIARLLRVIGFTGVSVSQTSPLSIKGSDLATTWYPSNLSGLSSSQYDLILDLYEQNTKYFESLSSALATRKSLSNQNSNKCFSNGFDTLCHNCATLIKNNNNMRVAMLELSGWDTHNNQHKRLNKQMTILDNGIAKLKEGLGDEWANTVVVINTEFGRTVRENGTFGTDHGTGSSMFVLGGCVVGKKVRGQFTGLNKESLFKNRDIYPTTNIFSWLKSIIQQHYILSEEDLDFIFPEIATYNENIIA